MSDLKLTTFGRDFRQLFPHRFGFGPGLQTFQKRDGPSKILIVDRGPKFDQIFVQRKNRLLISFVDHDLSFSSVPQQINDFAFDRNQSDLVRSFDVVKNAQIVAILRDHDVALGDPLDVTAKTDQSFFSVFFQIVKMQFESFVAEQKFLTGFVQLKNFFFKWEQKTFLIKV